MFRVQIIDLIYTQDLRNRYVVNVYGDTDIMSYTSYYQAQEIKEILLQDNQFNLDQLWDILNDEKKISIDPEVRAKQAFAMFSQREIPTNAIMTKSAKRVELYKIEKETFVPIFLTNYCDSQCKMCGMRKSNKDLIRKFSNRKHIIEQLSILKDVDQVYGVGFLTGEYQDKYTRLTNAFYTGWAINQALEMGFQQVYFNIGSLTPDEIEVLSSWLPEGHERITMCVFQESYNRSTFAKYMGKKKELIPKADYDRRIQSFESWLDAGFKAVNPGFLVGLHDPGEELVNILRHVSHLENRGARISVSLPRLRPALNAVNQYIMVSDEDYVRLISIIAYFSPQSGIVLTTRENINFQDRVMPFVRTISPGSPDVAPYKRDSEAPNNEKSSQFLIPDHRRPIDILQRLKDNGYQFKYFKG
jgi:3-methyl-2-indolic acid synthase